MRQMEKQRQKLIKKAKMKLKAEFQEQPEREVKEHPKINQVTDELFFRETSGVEDFYKIKELKLDKQRELKHYVPEKEIWMPNLQPQLEVIDEQLKEESSFELE